MDSGTGDPVWRSDSAASRVAVIVGLRLEAKVLRRIRAPDRPRVCISGPGSERAFLAATGAIDEGAKALMSFGLAGGIGAGADTGTVVVPETLKSDAGAWKADPPWRQRLILALKPGFRLLEGPIYSAGAVVVTPRDKAGLASSTGAVAVDMESAGIARAAAEAGLPFVAIRVVADGPEDSLPENVETLVSASGGTRLSGLPAMLLSFRRLHLLAGLALRSRRARAELARVIRVLSGPG